MVRVLLMSRGLSIDFNQEALCAQWVWLRRRLTHLVNPVHHC